MLEPNTYSEKNQPQKERGNQTHKSKETHHSRTIHLTAAQTAIQAQFALSLIHEPVSAKREVNQESIHLGTLQTFAPSEDDNRRKKTTRTLSGSPHFPHRPRAFGAQF
jgi:hypothetical protein